MVTKAAIEHIPSLPQVLVKILNAIHSDHADYQNIADIIRHDSGVATRLIAVANSSYFGRPKGCESIERALLFLGTDAVKTIVITASIKQFFGNFNQRHSQFLQSFWRRSLVAANFAQVLATLTSYPTPEDAYLCGLLANVGQLMLLTSNEKQYLQMLEGITSDQQLLAAEQELFEQTHCQLGADLIDSWNITGFMSDAVRYHHEPSGLLQDAHHLVKIVNLASQLSHHREIDDTALASANSLFGLNESLTRELRSRIDSDVDKMASSLGIDIVDDNNNEAQRQAKQQLGERLGDLGELAQLNVALWQARNQDSLQQSAQRSLFLTLGINGSVLFLRDPDSGLLCSQSPANPEANQGSHPAEQLNFTLAIEPERSLISDAFLQSQPQNSLNHQQPLSIIDRQMLRYCGAEILVCWPLIASTTDLPDQPIGVLVFACDEQKLSNLTQRKTLAQSLCHEIANAIATSKQRFESINTNGAAAEHFQQQISEAVHEASNPLSIIRNYLEMLRIKLGEGHTANEGLELIKEEIDRVGNILLRLNEPEQYPNNIAKTANINRIIETTTHIFKDSICATKQIQLDVKLDPKLNSIPGNPEHLKQILTNLLKNAVEALSTGGTITVSSEASVSFSGRNFSAIHVEDNGPGIDEEIKQQLFSPISSSKGQGHSGLGLSIVKKLIDEMDGSIVCRSNAEKGTQFQILLPKD